MSIGILGFVGLVGLEILGLVGLAGLGIIFFCCCKSINKGFKGTVVNWLIKGLKGTVVNGTYNLENCVGSKSCLYRSLKQI